MSHPVWRRASLAACVTVFLLGLLMAVRPLSSNPGPTIAMSVSASPANVAVGGLVSYSIALSNSEDERTSNLQVVATLPAGFTYVPGSTVLSFNGIASWWHDQQPFVSGRVLTWNQAAVPDFTVPPKREGNYYGIHTFVQDHFTTDKYDKQLNQARELGGPGAFVTQLLYPVTPQTMSARSEWRDFVQRTCNKGLTPIIRLATEFKGSYWEKPSLDGALAQAFGRVVADVRSVLPAACTLYVQVLNETNLTIEWSGEWPDPIAYGQFLVQAAQAIRSQTANDSRIKILNGALSPGGNYNNVTYTWDMLGVPGALEAWDAWATHPYPANHPAGYNIHAGTAYYPELTIDSYILELQQISRRGRHVFDVLATETGYRLTDSTYQFEGYPPINDVLRAGYIRDAFQNNSGGAYGTWTNWPEFRAATPYELSDPARNWWQFDWIDASDRPYLQYTYVRDIPYKPGFEPDGALTITFQARVGYNTGMQTMNVSATADNASIAPASTTVYVSPAVHTHTPTPTTAPGQPTPTTTATSQATPTATASATVTATPSASPTPILCTPSLLGSFSLPDRPKGLAVDAATHRLHVGLFDSSRLAIYDTQSHSFIGEVNTGGLHSNGVAVDQASGTVYVANRDSRNVSAINGRAPVGATLIPVGNLPFGVAVGEGRAYVANFGLENEEGTVTIIDTANNTVMSTARIGPRPALAAAGDGKGYIVSAGTGTGSGALYALSSDADIASVQTGYFAFGAAYLDGRIYVTHRGADHIAVVDATTSQLLHTIPISGPLYAIVANPSTGHIFAVNAASSRVYAFDAATMTLIGDIPVDFQDADHGGQGIAVDPALNKVFVAAYGAQKVSVIQDCLASGQPTPTATATAMPTVIPSPSPSPTPTPTAIFTPSLTPTPTATAVCTPGVVMTHTAGVHPKSLAMDVSSGLLHVALFDSSELIILNAADLTTVATLALAPLGSSQLNGIAVDQATGRVYVTSKANNNVAVLDGRTQTWLTRIAVGALPWGVAAADGRAYVANFGDNSVSILDTVTSSLLGTAGVGSQPALAAAGDGKGYVTSFAAGEVNIISGSTDVMPVSVGVEPLGIAYDNGMIYVGSRSGKRLTAVDAATGVVVYTTTLPGPAYAVAINPGNGHVYAVDAAKDRLYIVEAATGAVLANLPVGQQDVTDGGQGLVVDTIGNRVFVANYAAGSLTVIQDCGPAAPTPTPTATLTPGSFRFFLPIIMIDYDAESVTSISAQAAPAGLSGDRLRRLPITGRAVAVDQESGYLFAAQRGRGVTIVDRRLGVVTTVLGDELAAAEPGALLAAGGRLYVSLPAENSVLALAMTGKGGVATIRGLARPFGLAFDAQRRRLYVAEAGSNTIAVIDTSKNEIVERLTAGRAPFILGLDGENEMLYAATPGDKSVWAIPLADGKASQRLPVPGLGLVLGLTTDEAGQPFMVYAVSPKTRAISVLEEHTGGYALRTVYEGDCATPLTGASGIVAYGGRVYVTDGGALLAFDAHAGSLLGRMGVGMTADTFGLAVHRASGRIVAADILEGTVTVIEPR